MDIRRDDGMAMVMAMAATLLTSALGVALVLATSSEAVIASNFRDQAAGAYAAEAAVERALDDLAAAGNWNAVLERNGAIDIRRRRAWRHARAGRWIDDRSRARRQHGRLRQNPAVRRCRHGCGHGAASVGAEQSAMAAVRVWPPEGSVAERVDRFTVLCERPRRATTRRKRMRSRSRTVRRPALVFWCCAPSRSVRAEST